MTTVGFCGHFSLTQEDENKIELSIYGLIEKLIVNGASEFLFYPCNQFDYICAKTVKELKKRYPHIVSVLCLPFLDISYISHLYDYVVSLPIKNDLGPSAHAKITEAMVDKSDIIIAYINHDKGKWVQTLKYARKKNKLIINIADDN